MPKAGEVFSALKKKDNNFSLQVAEPAAFRPNTNLTTGATNTYSPPDSLKSVIATMDRNTKFVSCQYSEVTNNPLQKCLFSRTRQMLELDCKEGGWK